MPVVKPLVPKLLGYSASSHKMTISRYRRCSEQSMMAGESEELAPDFSLPAFS